MNRKQAISYLDINEKQFDNYFKYSNEIKGEKINGRWYFDESKLKIWNDLKNSRVVSITMKEYEQCLNFGLKMAYNLKNTAGTGIRGVRSKMQTADDFTFGVLAEIGFQKFVKEKFRIDINLDLDVHTEKITPQDIISITESNFERPCNFKVAIKSSKIKSCFNIIKPLEYEDDNRNSDIYVFIRVSLPDDHIFSYLNEKHKIFNGATFERQISNLNEIQIWVCGFNRREDFKRANEIPGQKFDDGYRYIVSTSEMKNTNDDWLKLLSEI